MVNTYTTGYYSAINKDQIMNFLLMDGFGMYHAEVI